MNFYKELKKINEMIGNEKYKFFQDGFVLNLGPNGIFLKTRGRYFERKK